MKTTMIARCVFAGAAIFAAAGLIGCGAESGQGESGAIGESSQALDRTTRVLDNITAAATAPQADQVRSFAASCVMHDAAGKDLLLVAGGYLDGSSHVSNDYYLFDASATPGLHTAASTQWITSGTFNTGRAHAKMIQIPGHTNECLLVGGEGSTGAAVSSDTSLKFSMNTSTHAITVSAAGTSFTPRSKFALSACGNSSIVAIGGIDATTRKAAIEVWSYSANWAAATTALSAARYDFALAPAGDSGKLKFVVAGGNEQGVGPSTSIDTLVFSTSGGVECKGSAVTNYATAGHALSVARNLPAAFKTSYTAANGVIHEQSTIVVAAGDDGTNTKSTSDSLAIDWTAPAITQSAGPGLVGGTALRRPTLVLANGLPILVGGETTVAAAPATTAILQKFSAGAFVAVTTNNLATARAGAVAEWVPSQTASGVDYVYVAGGHPNTSNAPVASVEEVSAP